MRTGGSPMTKRHNHHIWNILEPSYWWPSSVFCWQLGELGPISCFLCPKNAKCVILKAYEIPTQIATWGLIFWGPSHVCTSKPKRFLHENHFTGDEIDMNHSPTTHQSLYLYLHAEFPHLWCSQQPKFIKIPYIFLVYPIESADCSLK